MNFKLAVPIAVGVLSVGCGETNEPIQESILSYSDYFAQMKERDIANEPVNCEELVEYIDRDNYGQKSLDVLNYVATSNYKFQQCTNEIEAKRIDKCAFETDRTQQSFFKNKVDPFGKMVLDDVDRILCKNEVAERLNGYNQEYKVPSTEQPFFELVGQNTLFNPATITTVEWAHNDVYSIYIKTTGDNYELFFTDEDKFNKAMSDIRTILPRTIKVSKDKS